MAAIAPDTLSGMSAVLLKGKLYGLNRDADCEVIAWRPADGSPTYLQMRVIDAPLDLPDGTYTLVVDGTIYATERLGGWWQMVHVAPLCA